MTTPSGAANQRPKVQDLASNAVALGSMVFGLGYRSRPRLEALGLREGTSQMTFVTISDVFTPNTDYLWLLSIFMWVNPTLIYPN